MAEEINDSDEPLKPTWVDRLLKNFSGEIKSRPELLEILTSSEKKGLFNKHTLTILEGALSVSEMQVREVLIPRAQMVAIQEMEKPENFLPKVIKSAHSRFPVIGEQSSEVIGILLAKDLLPYLLEENLDRFEIKKVARPVRIVPMSKRLDELLQEFRDAKAHMAVVVDEYGEVAGLVTIEDVLEQIVGDIEDETDHDEDPTIKPQSNGVYLVKAITDIEDFNVAFKTNFPSDDFDTIGGIVTNAFGRLPKRGEYLVLASWRFQILNADSRRIRLLEVRSVDATKRNQ